MAPTPAAPAGHDEPAAQALSLYALAFEHLPLGVCLFDAQACLLAANPRYRQMWQLPESLYQPGSPLGDLRAAQQARATVAAAASPLQQEWLTQDGQKNGG